MTESTIGVSAPVAAAAKPPPLAGRLFGTFVPRLITGLAILLVWEFVVRAFAPAYVAKPTTVVMAIPRVIADPAFLQATGATLSRGGRRPRHRAGVRHRHRPADGTQPDVRTRHPPLRQRLLRHADDRRAAAVLVVVRLFRRDADRHHHLRRDLLHHHQCRRRRALGAARISRSRALVPLRPRCACWSRSCCRRRCPICWPASGSPPAAR